MLATRSKNHRIYRVDPRHVHLTRAFELHVEINAVDGSHMNLWMPLSVFDSVTGHAQDLPEERVDHETLDSNGVSTPAAPDA